MLMKPSPPPVANVPNLQTFCYKGIEQTEFIRRMVCYAVDRISNVCSSVAFEHVFVCLNRRIGIEVLNRYAPFDRAQRKP
jgi:hypothetical protein